MPPTSTQPRLPRVTATMATVMAAIALPGCSASSDLSGIVLEEVTSTTAPVVQASPTTEAPDRGRPKPTDDVTATPTPPATPIQAVQAKEVALAWLGSGTVLYAEDEDEDGQDQVDVHVRQADGTWWEVTVDLATGRVVDAQPEPGADDLPGDDTAEVDDADGPTEVAVDQPRAGDNPGDAPADVPSARSADAPVDRSGNDSIGGSGDEAGDDPGDDSSDDRSEDLDDDPGDREGDSGPDDDPGDREGDSGQDDDPGDGEEEPDDDE